MNQYYIIEIQKYLTGEFGHIVHYAYDENPTMARLKAESKYHEVLAAAAISALPQHSATLMASDGRAIINQCYKHEVEPTPEPEDEPVEPEDEPTPEPEGE